MLIAKNGEELWPAFRERSLSAGMLLQTTLIEDCNTTTTWLWENSGADFIHWSSGQSFTLFSYLKVEKLPLPLPCPIHIARLHSDECVSTYAYAVNLQWILHYNHVTTWQHIVSQMYVAAMFFCCDCIFFFKLSSQFSMLSVYQRLPVFKWQLKVYPVQTFFLFTTNANQMITFMRPDLPLNFFSLWISVSLPKASTHRQSISLQKGLIHNC